MKRLIILTISLLLPLSAWATVVKPTQVDMEFQTVIALDGNNNPEYVGKALEPCAASEACWQIKKITYSGTAPVSIYWANGSHAYDFIWDNRASYTYS